MNYEDLIFQIASSFVNPVLFLLTFGFVFDCLNNLLFPRGRWE